MAKHKVFQNPEKYLDVFVYESTTLIACTPKLFADHPIPSSLQENNVLLIPVNVPNWMIIILVNTHTKTLRIYKYFDQIVWIGRNKTCLIYCEKERSAPNLLAGKKSFFFSHTKTTTDVSGMSSENRVYTHNILDGKGLVVWFWFVPMPFLACLRCLLALLAWLACLRT